jgi:hypothetical protein
MCARDTMRTNGKFPREEVKRAKAAKAMKVRFDVKFDYGECIDSS